MTPPRRFSAQTYQTPSISAPAERPHLQAVSTPACPPLRFATPTRNVHVRGIAGAIALFLVTPRKTWCWRLRWVGLLMAVMLAVHAAVLLAETMNAVQGPSTTPLPLRLARTWGHFNYGDLGMVCCRAPASAGGGCHPSRRTSTKKTDMLRMRLWQARRGSPCPTA
jgi:hypothetical protein